MNTVTDQHGITYHTRRRVEYEYLDGQACCRREMRGDPVGFFCDTTIILQVEELEDG